MYADVKDIINMKISYFVIGIIIAIAPIFAGGYERTVLMYRKLSVKAGLAALLLVVIGSIRIDAGTAYIPHIKGISIHTGSIGDFIDITAAVMLEIFILMVLFVAADIYREKRKRR